MPQSTNGILTAEPPSRPADPTPDPPPSLLSRAAGAVSTLTILTVLAALAYWGHHTDWQFTATSAGPSAGPLPAHWLEVAPEGKGPTWCPRHGVHACPLCEPVATQIKLPPKVLPADGDKADRALVLRERPVNDPACVLAQRVVRFESDEAVTKAGIDIAPVWTLAMTEAVAAPGEVNYDRVRVAGVSSRAAGQAWRVLKRLGDKVRVGEVLAVIDAGEVGKAKSEFVQGLLQLDVRGRTLRDIRSAESAIPARQLREAEASYREAQVRLAGAQQALVNFGLPVRVEDFQGGKSDEVTRKLQLLGLPASLASSLDASTTTSSLLPVRSTLDGEVTAADVVAGEVVESGKMLFTVADTSRMWLELGVAGREAPLVRVGQKVVFRPDGAKEDVTGLVSWVSTATEESTRTVRVRADLPNPEGLLLSGTLGTGRIILREEPKAVAVPSEAIQEAAGCHFVFVRDRTFLDPDGAKRFHVRTVRPGTRNGDNTEVIAGLWPGEVVVTKGSAFLRSEVLRNLVGPKDSGHRE